MALKKFCRKTGCNNLTTDIYCEAHKVSRYSYDKHRESAAKRGYDHRWRKGRLKFLQKHPLCKHCFDAGKLTGATVVDHILPHKGDRKLFWNRKNWQGLCDSCHSVKTAKEDGGFGNGLHNDCN
ncbi:HNH endonuclease signature motif containing protein [Paenibacillus popilliae]|uniref:Putative HNH nuclease YajD n=1 Tax=Paenibacillus popilliae ATCC 14706 TaxID=1212764 RepID=M9L7E0_PAEPP|nr:HNH endonuclease [Paenibacillus popilliae]GAC40847.1 restriction endonuclease [Paenibacillus popilliae ATCC 14706]